MRDKLQLSPDLFLAEGTEHQCFRHPGDSSRCIKVLHPDTRAGRFRREIRYYSRLHRRGAD